MPPLLASGTLAGVFRRFVDGALGKEEKEGRETSYWRAGLGAAILTALVVVGIDGSKRGVLGTTLLLACAGLFVGGLAGFVFGIPKSLQQKKEETAADGSSGSKEAKKELYRGNTNLEEISDWLTKILVGVGLTQLLRIPSKLHEFASYLSPAFGKEPDAERFALGLLLYFPTAGFLFGYLWTRLFLGRAFTEADRLTEIEDKLNAQELQARADATALGLSYQQLARSQTQVPFQRLKDAMRAASPSVRVTAFNQARELRARTWSSDRAFMERTIPIFEALIDADVERRFHNTYGQLGYALKDQSQPDWARAEENLTLAIQARGPWREAGYSIYELNRAVCRIKRDPEFAASKKSVVLQRDRVLGDLRVGWQDNDSRGMFEADPIDAWLLMNGLTTADVERDPEPA